jgi:hypothetical protein
LIYGSHTGEDSWEKVALKGTTFPTLPSGYPEKIGEKPSTPLSTIGAEALKTWS